MNQLCSLEAEQSIIGAAMLDGELVTTLAEIVRPVDMYTAAHRAIWGAVINLAKQGKPADVVTLSEHLEANGQLDELGGMSALAEMVRNTPASSNATVYADIVADLAQRRRLLGTLPEAERRIADRHTPTAELITHLQSQLEGLRRQEQSQLLRAAEYLSDDFLTPLDQRFSGEAEAMGLSYGLKDLDDATLGMKPTELIVVGGRPSMGKSGFMMNTLRTALEAEKPVLIESLEMKRPALFLRLLAGMSNVPLAFLQDPRNNNDFQDEYFARLSYPVTVVNQANLYINHDTPRTISQVRAQTKEIYDRHGEVGLVMIDYLGKVKVEGDHKRHDLGIEEVVAGAKQIAKEFNCPVMLLSQLNRQLEQRPNKRPNMGDLKDSSAIEQEADTILFLYRDEVYHPDNADNKGIAEIIIGKQREGRTDTVFVASRLSHARFEDLVKDEVARMREAGQQPAPEKQKSAMANF